MKGNNADDRIRCECGKMYLIKTKEGYEFKCRRCKRICLLRYEQLIVDYLTREEGFIDINKV